MTLTLVHLNFESVGGRLTKTQRKFAIQALRSASLKWKPRSEAIKNARVARGTYECAKCKNHLKRLDGNVDHINPVVDPIKGPETMDIYIERLLVEVEGWQWLCRPCHALKTIEEHGIRVKDSDPFQKPKKSRKKTKRKKKK
jgi:5-methylcytosine-specific restriction endonuclease McrA